MMCAFCVFVRSVNVPRCGLERFMTKKYLNGGRISPLLGKIGCETMAKRMRGSWYDNTEKLLVTFYLHL